MELGGQGDRVTFPNPVLQVWGLELSEATFKTQDRYPAGEGMRGGSREHFLL